MQAIYWDVLLILGLIVASGVLAMSEFAIGSARKSQLRDWSSQGYRGAAAALGLSDDSRTCSGPFTEGRRFWAVWRAYMPD